MQPNQNGLNQPQQPQVVTPTSSPPSPPTQSIYPEPAISTPSPPAQQDPAEPRTSSKNYVVTFLLSWLLGHMGADRFYLGKIGTGLLKLFTLGGFGIWYWIDLLSLVYGRTTDKSKLPLHGYQKNRIWTRILALLPLIIVLLGIIAALVIILLASDTSNKSQPTAQVTPQQTIKSTSGCDAFSYEGYAVIVNLVVENVDESAKTISFDTSKQSVLVGSEYGPLTNPKQGKITSNPLKYNDSTIYCDLFHPGNELSAKNLKKDQPVAVFLKTSLSDDTISEIMPVDQFTPAAN